jgi:ketosteroid isomerase-like protein
METQEPFPRDVAEQGSTRLLGRALIDTFGQGWERGNLDLLMSVYADNVVFVETPFSSALKGVDEVRRYWADTPYHQSEVKRSHLL